MMVQDEHLLTLSDNQLLFYTKTQYIDASCCREHITSRLPPFNQKAQITLHPVSRLQAEVVSLNSGPISKIVVPIRHLDPK